LELNSWIPPLLVNNIFCFIFGGKFSQVGGSVTEQHVVGQGLHTCNVGVNMKILIWIMWPRILISGGGFSLEESEREIRSAWDAW